MAKSDSDIDIQVALNDELRHRETTDKLFGKAFAHHDSNNLVDIPTDFDCLRDLYYAFETHCRPFEDYSLKFVKHLVHTCETETPE